MALRCRSLRTEKCFENWMRPNSFTPAPMGLDRCKIVKYYGLSDITYTDLSYYRYFFVTARILGLHH